MASYAKIVLLGNIGEPTITYNGDGKPFLKFGLAVNSKSKAGVEHTDWHDCVISGAFAETMASYLKKGMLVMLDGRPTINKSTKDGVTRYFHSVYVDNLQMCSAKDGNGAANVADGAADDASRQAYASAPQGQPASQQPANNGGFDDDTPF